MKESLSLLELRKHVYSRNSMARTLMARLPWLFELILESLGNNPLAADLGNLLRFSFVY